MCVIFGLLVFMRKYNMKQTKLIVKTEKISKTVKSVGDKVSKSVVVFGQSIEALSLDNLKLITKK